MPSAVHVCREIFIKTEDGNRYRPQSNDTEDLNPIKRFGRTQMMMFAVKSRIALQYQYFDSGENLW